MVNTPLHAPGKEPLISTGAAAA